jgi:hypothetical protein
MPTRKPTKIGLIEDETAILPHVVAQGVAETIIFQKMEKLGTLLKKGSDPDYVKEVKELVEYLTEKAQVIYEHNEKFRKELKKDSGVKYLRMFMEHWSEGKIKRDSPCLAYHKFTN